MNGRSANPHLVPEQGVARSCDDLVRHQERCAAGRSLEVVLERKVWEWELAIAAFLGANPERQGCNLLYKMTKKPCRL
eukprot:719891-Pelagomonas_calceolata.AAC.1